MSHSCTGCRLIKPASDFHKCRSKKSGLHSYCKACSKEIYRKKWLVSRLDPVKMSKRVAYTKNNKDGHKARYLKNNYWPTLTAKEALLAYKSLLSSQNNLCAICSKPETVKFELSVDHDHDTGQVRALLCGKCNMGLGLFKECRDLLKNAEHYLEKYGK